MNEETTIIKKSLNQKQKKILIAIGILVFLMLIIGVSYAWWSHTAYQESINTINTDCLKLSITDEVDERGESTAIKLEKAYPLTDAEASLLKPYEFKIQNVCQTTAEYSVNLEIMKVENKLESKYLNIDFNKSGKRRLTEYEEIEPSYKKEGVEADEARHFANGVLEGNESASYSIRIWIDENVTIEDDAANKTFIGKISISSVLNQLATNNLSELIIRKSEVEESIEKVEHEATEQTPALIDYRYTGKDPNNYVCFGYEGERCPDENLYRIIGVIPTQSSENGTYENRVKLIKNEYYMNENALTTPYSPIEKGYLWNTTKNNKWEESSLKEELNTEYWNSLGEYQKYIEKAKWYLGATNQNQGKNYTAHQFYQSERSNTQGYSKGVTSYINNIGLLYLSDLGFSISKSFWNNSMYSSQKEYKSNAWVYNLGEPYYEWTISPETSTYNEHGTLSWAISAEGGSNVVALNYGSVQAFAIRPTFYLKGEVTYKSGEGTIDNPYYLAIK